MKITRTIFQYQASVFTAVLLSILALLEPGIASEFNQSVIRLVQLDVPVDAVEDAKVLVVSTNNGDIIITGTDTDRVVADVDINVSGRKSEICEEIAEKVRIQITRPPQGNERLIIDPEIPRKIGYSVSISYRITMPKRLGVDLETTNGELLVENSQGNVEMESTNGSIVIKNVRGDVTASSVNGSIMMEKLISSKLTAETINGQIECLCTTKAPDNMEISTVNGSIEVLLPKGVNASLSAETVNGGLFISTGRGEITSKSRGSIELSIGGGLGKYELSSINGSINLTIAESAD